MLAALLILASLSTAHAGACNLTAATGLVSDLSEVVTCDWKSMVGNALVFLKDKNNPASAKYEAHAAAEKIRQAEKEGRLSASDSAKLQDALAYVWHRADEYEQAWNALANGKFQDAKDKAHQLADRIRQARDQGSLTDEEAQALLERASRLWELANRLYEAGKLTGTAGMNEAHDIADDARELQAGGWLSEAQAKAVTSQAGKIYTSAKGGASPSPSTGGTTAGTGSAGDVPYFSQYKNGINPGGSCQNTSLAMLLNYYGVKVTPDQISSRFGTSYAQDPNNLARVFNTYASEAGISERLRAQTAGSLADFNAQLDSGTPTIVHGYFTGYGHVVLATGRDSTGYTVNDPAGVWSQSFKGGYSGSYNGDGVHYGTSAMVSAIATYDGRTQTTLWYHEVYRP